MHRKANTIPARPAPVACAAFPHAVSPWIPRSHPGFASQRTFAPLLPGCVLADDRDSYKEQVKAANDIVDVIGGYLTLRPAGPTFKALCPFHDDNRPSFDVDPRRQRYRCWSCGKVGDVFSFVMEQERLGFQEALELLAQRAGIPPFRQNKLKHGPDRARMLEAVHWAAEQFHQCLLEDPLAEQARVYLGQRQLTGETVRRFGLGFAPPSGSWLLERASRADMAVEVLEQVGLVAPRTGGPGYYDRFRDRVLFPIRDLRGREVAFGGRILPNSPLLQRDVPPPKYYNSAENAVFQKSEQLFGIDLARQAATKAGYLAVVEGYTDVCMAHQMGVSQVVATMGTALTTKHVQKLRGLVPRVLLVFDADAGGDTGVDRALEVFVRQEMDLQVATLPDGLDPCDLLVQRGAAALQEALTGAVDVLEFKLNRVWLDPRSQGLDGRRRAVDAVLTVLAQAPQERSVKLDLMVNRIAHRAQVREEVLWSRLRELRAGQKDRLDGKAEVVVEERQAPASSHELELVEVLLAQSDLVTVARQEVPSGELEHPGLRLLVEGLYRLEAEGRTPNLDGLRERLEDRPRLLARALELAERGRTIADGPVYLQKVLTRFRERRCRQASNELRTRLQAVVDPAQAAELLRQLQNQSNQ